MVTKKKVVSKPVVWMARDRSAWGPHAYHLSIGAQPEALEYDYHPIAREWEGGTISGDPEDMHKLLAKEDRLRPGQGPVKVELADGMIRRVR